VWSCLLGRERAAGGLWGASDPPDATASPPHRRRLDTAAVRGPLPSGIYFLTMTDAAGAESENTKVVVLR